MTVTIRHDRHRHGMAVIDDAALLELPEAQPILHRICASVDIDYPDRRKHIERIGVIVIRAKQRPGNPFARATL